MRLLRTAPAACCLLALAAAATATPAAAQAAGDRAALVVSTAWLAAHLDDPNLVLLHVGERPEYDREHIPGARFISLSDVSTPHDHDDPASLALQLPPADELRRRLERFGVSDDSRVVVYYGKDWISPSTRIVFTLDYLGLGAQASLLDGGMQAWKREGRRVTAEAPPARQGRLSSRPTRDVVATADWVRRNLRTPGVAVVDGRARVFYDGVEEGGPRRGHVAGALSIPFTEIADDSLKLRSPAELRALFARAGVKPGDTVVAYCHIGQQATAVVFAARLLGHPVKLYDGSFQEWSRRPELPVENPAADRGGRR